MTSIESPNEWSELFPDLVNEIVKYIYSLKDYVMIRATCKGWNLALPENPKHTRGPWLILPFDKNSSHPVTNKIEEPHNLKVPRLRMPEMSKTELVGSCFGWLICVTNDGTVQALNPFTRSHFNLPHLSTFPEVLLYQPHVQGMEYLPYGMESKRWLSKFSMQRYYIKKIILSCSPNQDKELMAVAIYGLEAKLAFYKFGDDKWTDIGLPESQNRYLDVIFSDGKICGLEMRGNVYEYDINRSSMKIKLVFPPRLRNFFNFHCDLSRYLVCNSNGDMFLVFKRRNWYTRKFIVYKLDKSTRIWSKECGLGNDVLVVGRRSSVLMEPFVDDEGKWITNCVYYSDVHDERNWITNCQYHSDVDDEGKLITNCVYYSDGREYRGADGCDVGIYNFETSENDQLCSYLGRMNIPSPIWI